MRRKKKILIIVALVLATLTLGITYYINDYYPALSKATSAEVLVDYGKDIVIRPTHDTKNIGIAFYPGGKVASDAYIELLAPLAEKGYTVVIAKMPAHLAVLNPKRMDRIRVNHPEIKQWYLGGHSLGGAMAANYLASHQDTIKGLFLLGAYSTKDIQSFEGPVISLYGSEDGVLNRDKYQASFNNLPESAVSLEIEGANHAQFGSYGEQAKDGIPTLSSKEQQELTRTYILKMIETKE